MYQNIGSTSTVRLPSGLPFGRHDTTASERTLQNVPAAGAFARRIHGWTWQGFPIGMGTGAVYVTLSSLHNHPPGVKALETCFYFLNLALFVTNVTMLSLQAICYPRQSWRLIQDPNKGVFVPLCVLSFATLIIGTINYGVPNVVSPTFIYVLFWVYVAASVIVCFPMLMIWFNKPHDLTTFTPAWAFLIFPMMLVGVIGFNVLSVQDLENSRSQSVLLVGYFFQGLGFFMTFFYLGIYVIRVMTTGFLDGHQANGAFVAAGPPGFTALALLKLGEYSQGIFEDRDDLLEDVGEIWYAASIIGALLLYGLAVFFFVFAALPYWRKVHKNLHEILGCWALTFPNVGWINTTKLLGDIFESEFLYAIHAIMTSLICITWLVLFVLTVIAFCKGAIFHSSSEDVLQGSSKTSPPPMEEKTCPGESREGGMV